jgi:4,5-dihydroxyphthalate decarboxylase
MSRLSLTVASWDYDRVRALIDGRVRIEGCDVNYIVLSAEECFHRAYLHSEFDVSEIGFGPYLIGLSRGQQPYTAVPAFLSRAFRHSAIYVRNDRGLNGPEDLRGRRVGVPEYQMTAVMWVRGFLQDQWGIGANEINWVQGGLEEPGRRDKFPINIPQGFPLVAAPAERSLTELLVSGEIDAIMSARAPSCFLNGHPRVRRLFTDYRTAEREYFRSTGLFPIMHAVGVRRDLADRYPWLPASVFKAFCEAKRIADNDLREVVALKIGLPWVRAELEATEEAMGTEFWPYGVEANRKTLEAMARYSHQQYLAVKQIAVEEMFAASTLEDTKV